MRNEAEVREKRAYWLGVYHTLDPNKRTRSAKSQKTWLTAEVWLRALAWALGQATDSSTTIAPPAAEDKAGWDD